MNPIAFMLVMMPAMLAVAATPPASVPATPPTSRPSEMEPLADGTVRYTPPENWNLIVKRPDGLGATYQSRDQTSTIVITIIPQDRAVADSSRDAMARIIDKGIREAAAKEHRALLIAPRVEQDDRFFLKMHDAVQIEGGVAERIQMYRVIGLNLVHVAASAAGEQLDDARDVFDKAERLMAGMRVSRGAKRVLYPRAQLRAIVPLDWTDRKIDQANGPVATYADPKEPSRQLLLGARIIPKAAREDKAKLDALVVLMIDQERALPARLTANGEDQNVPGATYLRQTHATALSDKDGAMLVDTRYIVVGDVLASVRSIAKASDAVTMNSIAEKFAGNLRPVKD